LAEGEALASALEGRGALVADREPFDAALAVTCAVTGPAEAKARRLIRRLRSRFPGIPIVACGCAAQAAAEDLRRAGADAVVGNRLKAGIPDLLERLLSGEAPSDPLRVDGLFPMSPWDDLPLDRPRMHQRAFVRIQEGCDRACSYCIVPRLRGPSIFRDPRAVAEELRRVVASGCSEAVLTGVCLAGNGENLAEILRVASRVPGLRRLRLGSLEPFAVDPELLAILADGPFCPHLHLPLQSGDSGILERMRRGYTPADFASLVREVRRRLGEEVHVGTDLLVGYPGEDDGAFERSLALCEELRFGRIHVFPFSPRRGTDAASAGDRLPPEILRERVSRASALGTKLLSTYAERFVGREVEVLAERTRQGCLLGLTPHYLRACLVGEGKPGDYVSGRAAREERGTLLAEGARRFLGEMLE
jgi:threonylcarbamoyladenosine tRNA methylthiotransferase MtaB